MKILTIFITILLISCGKKEAAYTTEVIDGIKYINNLAPERGENNKISLKFVQKIGVLDGDENYMFHQPFDICRDKESNYYILDRGNYRIQKYDKDLNFLISYGRKGQGPGELGGTHKIRIDETGKLYVIDAGNNFIQVFNNDGSSEMIIRPGKNLGRAFFYGNDKIVLSGFGAAFTSTRDLENLLKKEYNTAVVIDQTGKILLNFGQTRKYENKMMKIRGNDFSYTSDPEGNHFLSFWHQNRIEKYSPEGKLLFCADRKLDYPETEILKSRMEPPNFFGQTVQVDNNGRIWVQTNTRQKTKIDRENLDTVKDLYWLEVYNAEGILLERMFSPLNARLMLKKIIGDKIYFIDDRKEMAVYEYRIVEK